MVRKLLTTIVVIAALAVVAPAALAQCVSHVPNEVLIDNSYCIQVCPFEFYTFQMVGDFDGPESTPIIILTAGCTLEGGCQNVECTPLQPPAIEFHEDGHTGFYYGGANDCIDIRWYWVHDNYWNVELFSLCEGCFCLNFDDQLPVQLNGFDAIAGNSQVELRWTTASENNNDRFIIQRDGADLASVRSQGSTSTGHSYAWTDENVVNGRTYAYTLVAVSTNGQREALATKNATPTIINPGVVTDYALYQNYPNPFNPSTSIGFDLKESGFVTLKVYNPMGEEVGTLVNAAISGGRHAIEFNASNLPSGLYIYTMKVDGKFSAARKMLLVK